MIADDLNNEQIEKSTGSLLWRGPVLIWEHCIFYLVLIPLTIDQAEHHMQFRSQYR